MSPADRLHALAPPAPRPHRAADLAVIDRHFAGVLTPADERGLRAHLTDCPTCRAHYERHLLLAQLDPAALPAAERLGRGLGLWPARRTQAGRWLPLAALAGAAAVILVLWPSGLPNRSSQPVGLTSRGSDASVHAAGPQVGLLIYRVPAPDQVARLLAATCRPACGPDALGSADARPDPVAPVPAPTTGAAATADLPDLASASRDQGPDQAGPTLRPDDELAFAYLNRAGKGHLLVLGLDGAGTLHWYHPARPAAGGTDTRAGDGPGSIAIEAGPAPRELAEAIRLPLAGSTLTLAGLFVEVPLTVSQVEALVAAHGLAGLTGLPGAVLVERSFRLAP